MILKEKIFFRKMFKVTDYAALSKSNNFSKMKWLFLVVLHFN